MRQRWIFLLGSSLILWAVSERIFWSFWRSDENIFAVLLTLWMYLLATYASLLTLEYFRVSSFWGLILVGALYWWITEGIIAMTVFWLWGIPFPISLSWTGLAWHMPLSVLIFWWYHYKALTQSFKKSLLLSIGLWIFWGLWSITWFFEDIPLITTLHSYAIHAGIVTFAIMWGHKLISLSQVQTFISPKGEKITLLGMIGLFFVFITLPTVWYSILVLPFLAWIIYWGLRFEKKKYTQSGILKDFWNKISYLNLSTLFLTPVIATGIYGLMLSETLPIFPINMIFFPLSSLVWVILFIYALRKVSR